MWTILLLCAFGGFQDDEKIDPQEDKPVLEKQDKEVVVTATRTETTKDRTGSAVTVIGKEEIQIKGKTSALELLRTVPGLEVVQQGGNGGLTSVFLRGGNSSHTLVLIDGIRVNTPTTGAYNFADLHAINIERIEVLRGAQSTLYGSEAVGGVINIITHKGKGKLGVTVRTEGGTDRTWFGSVGASGGDELSDFSIVISSAETDGISSASEEAGNDEEDEYENSSVSARFGIHFLEDGRADLTLRAFRGEKAIDGFVFGVGPADDPNRTNERDSIYAGIQIRKPITEWFEPSLTVGISDEEFEGKDPDNPFSNFVINNRTVEATLQSDFFPTEWSTVTFGYTFERRLGESEGNFDEDLDIQSGFLIDQLSFEETLFITVGARIDDHSEFGSEPTYRGTVSYLIAETGTRIHASYGTGFRAPTLNDLFFPGFSNPNLDPEESVSIDFGVEQKLFDDILTVDVTVFRNDFDDLIAFDPILFIPINVAEARTQGLEATVTIRPVPAVQIVLTYTLMKTEDEATGDPLVRRPENRGTIQVLAQPIEGLHVSASLISVRERFDTGNVEMDDYERVDMSLSYAATESLKPYVRVENLFDKNYEEVNGFTSPGFGIYVGTELRW